MSSVEQYSLYLQTQLRRYPQWGESSHFTLAYQPNELKEKGQLFLSQASDLKDLNYRLRFFRNQQMVRIAQRDLGELSTLEENFIDTSDLADTLVKGALDWHFTALTKRYGVPIGETSKQPQSLLVMGMGKLGGQELNFSSDIDLIYVFPERGETQGSKQFIDNELFFTRLAQAINKSLSEYTEDGFVYRVDMRLRPFGSIGPLVVSFSAMENYYALHGRAWERYALVKARMMVGDQHQGAELMAILKPFVYRKYVDFTALDSLRDLKKQIAEKVQQKGMQDNIKLGLGGIREIEFIVQVFQLIYGGRIPSLQGRALIPMLKEVAQQGFLEPDVANTLEAVYRFLRRVENHLQIWNDQQVHSLPTKVSERENLAASVSLSLEQFDQKIHTVRQFVQNQFKAVFVSEDPILDPLPKISNEAFEGLLTGFYQQHKVLKLPLEAKQRLDKLMQMVLKEIEQQSLTEAEQVLLLNNVIKVIESILRRSVYFVLLSENAALIKGLLKVCLASPWMVDMLVKYPMLLENLASMSSTVSGITQETYLQEALLIQQQFELDEESFMNQLRQWRHIQVFNVALADISGYLPVMKVSDHLTWIAEAVLQASLQQAYGFMANKHGLPVGETHLALETLPFVVIGYGKLGGQEIGYGSDLDIIFVFDEQTKSSMSQGKRPLEAGLYFLRMAQKLISIMTSMMPTGKLYEIDVRLRPNGNSGLLVIDFLAYQYYLENKAWMWELQALVRARGVTGGTAAKSRFERIRKTCLGQKREIENVKKEVLDMRQKMKQSLDTSNKTIFDLKQGSGGIVDIEFMVQYFVLAYAHQSPNLLNHADNIQILAEIAQAKLLTELEAQKLIEIYQLYRETYHHLALQNMGYKISNNQFVTEREWVKKLWKKTIEN